MAEKWAVTVTPGSRENMSKSDTVRAHAREVHRLDKELGTARDNLAEATRAAVDADEMSVADVAQLMGVSPQAVYKLLKRAPK